MCRDLFLKSTWPTSRLLEPISLFSLVCRWCGLFWRSVRNLICRASNLRSHKTGRTCRYTSKKMFFFAEAELLCFRKEGYYVICGILWSPFNASSFRAGVHAGDRRPPAGVRAGLLLSRAAIGYLP